MYVQVGGKTMPTISLAFFCMNDRIDWIRRRGTGSPSNELKEDMLSIHELEESILRMTMAVRQGEAADVARSFGENPDKETRPLGWWVLACGEPLDIQSEEKRNASREKLLLEVRMAGVVLPENVWVWDESGNAQLVIATVPTLERAERLSRHLGSKGLNIRIRREKI